jgi:hypothetical protein
VIDLGLKGVNSQLIPRQSLNLHIPIWERPILQCCQLAEDSLYSGYVTVVSHSALVPLYSLAADHVLEMEIVHLEDIS